MLVLPDALRSPNQGRIRAGCPLVGSRTAPRRKDGNSPSLFLFSLQLSPICWKSLPHNLRPLLTFILFSTRCALCHCLFHSRPPPLSFPLTHVDYLSLFYCSLFLVRCLPLSGKQLFSLSSAHSLLIHCIFLVFSHSTSIAALHLFPSFCPIIFPFNSNTLCFHSALLTVSIWMNTSHCISPPLFSSVLPSLSLHLQTVPSVFAKH